MNWFKRIFGGTTQEPQTQRAASPEAGQPSPPPPAAKTGKQSRRKPRRRKQAQSLRPIDIAQRFARKVPGASVEDFGLAPRDDGLLARVTYTNANVTSRLAILSHPEEYSRVWLETRSIGKFGSFDACRTEPGAAFEVQEPRFFLTPTCFISGARLRNEAARILMLPEAARERLLALSAEVDTVSLNEQVMAACLGDLFQLLAILEDQQQGVAWLLELGYTLAYLGNQLPAVAEEIADLAEARTCRFCGGSFIFAPTKPTCTGCGAPAEAASVMPPRCYAPIQDNPVLRVDEDEREEHEAMLDRLRECARVLAKCVPACHVREEPERGRVFVEYALEGREFRVKLMEEYAGIRVAATGAKGDFYLSWSSVHVLGAQEGSAWRESERRVFFSEHCSVRSDHTTLEAARIASLPNAARASLVELCERYQGAAQLDEGYLAKNLEIREPESGMQEVLRCSRELALIADALPRDFDPQDTQRYQLEFCSHCRWQYFREAQKPRCLHCGAPAKSAAA